MSRARGFSLIEIVIAIAIMMIILLLAVPSLTGVLADKRLRHKLDNFGNLVREAQARSVAEHRTYLIVQDGQNLVVRAEAFAKGEKPTIARQLKLEETEGMQFSF